MVVLNEKKLDFPGIGKISLIHSLNLSAPTVIELDIKNFIQMVQQIQPKLLYFAEKSVFEKFNIKNIQDRGVFCLDQNAVLVTDLWSLSKYLLNHPSSPSEPKLVEMEKIFRKLGDSLFPAKRNEKEKLSNPFPTTTAEIIRLRQEIQVAENRIEVGDLDLQDAVKLTQEIDEKKHKIELLLKKLR
ncbi:MAG: hypothetical protein ACTSVL_11330 [Promethearchaeota archaeon]